MKLLLVQPPFNRLHRDDHGLQQLPLGLAFLVASVQQRTGWTVRLYNADLARDPGPTPGTVYLTGEGYRRFLASRDGGGAPVWREVRAVLREEAPDVVGITAMSPGLSPARAVARLAKELDPDVVTVLGGPHVSMVGASVLADAPELDLAVAGEGEITLVALLEALAGGRDPGGIEGVIHRGAEGPVVAPPRALAEDLDRLPTPATLRDGTVRDAGAYPPEAWGHLFAARGCPYRCVFCGSHKVWSRRVRSRSPGHVLAEIDTLHARHGVTDFTFDDDTFGIAEPWLAALCDGLRDRHPGLTWSAEIHPRLVEEGRIRRMAEAGCRTLWMGVETGSDALLARIGKRTTTAQIRRAARVIRRHDIRLMCYFVVGFPWETHETLAQTAALMKALRAEQTVYGVFTPYPGTQIFEECRELGLISRDHDPGRHTHQSADSAFVISMSRAEFRREVARIERLVDRLDRAGRVRWHLRHPRTFARKLWSRGPRFYLDALSR